MLFIYFWVTHRIRVIFILHLWGFSLFVKWDNFLFPSMFGDMAIILFFFCFIFFYNVKKVILHLLLLFLEGRESGHFVGSAWMNASWFSGWLRRLSLLSLLLSLVSYLLMLTARTYSFIYLSFLSSWHKFFTWVGPCRHNVLGLNWFGLWTSRLSFPQTRTSRSPTVFCNLLTIYSSFLAV